MVAVPGAIAETIEGSADSQSEPVREDVEIAGEELAVCECGSGGSRDL